MASSFEPNVLRGKFAGLGFGEIELRDGPLINARYFRRRVDGWRNISNFICARI